jgi:hypothetical protein
MSVELSAATMRLRAISPVVAVYCSTTTDMDDWSSSTVAPTARSASPEAAFTPCATDSVDACISVVAAVTACSSELTTVALRAVPVKAP